MAASHDFVADFGGACEGDFVDVRVMSQDCSSLAISADDVDDSLGESSLLDELAQHQSSDRGLLGRLDNNRAPSSQSRCHLPSLHQQRIVPRNDLTHNSHGLLLGIPKERPRHLKSRPSNLITITCKRLIALSSKGQILRLGIHQGLAIVERLHQCQLLQMLFDQLPKPIHNDSSVVGRHLGPLARVEGTSGCGDGEVDVLLACLFDLGEDLFGCGVVDGELLA
jgi:hypothetical protein